MGGAKMEDTLKNLEDEKKNIFRKLEKVGDFRRGTISVNYRKCGKSNCICNKEGHPGHGPQYLWNATIKGKSLAKNLSMGAELEKYTVETDNYRKFTQVCEEIVQVNEKVCGIRPVPEVNDDEVLALKKKLLKRFKAKYKEN
jgi:hypothetical protein